MTASSPCLPPPHIIDLVIIDNANPYLLPSARPCPRCRAAARRAAGASASPPARPGRNPSSVLGITGGHEVTMANTSQRWSSCHHGEEEPCIWTGWSQLYTAAGQTPTFGGGTFPRFPPRPSDAERGGGAVADKIPAPGHCSLSLYTTLAILTSRSIQNYFR